MTATGTTALLGVAADAALTVPGVAGLQPRLAHRLAAAAATRADPMPHRTPPEAGIRADRAPDGSGWHIEVRCVLAEGRRALDIARNVHDQVRTAVISHLPVPEPVTVTVTVTRIAARYDAA
ncbi:hypothetical protein AQI88_38220 [Streptomyces cellostaticus]|uniref:Asp23/Gls24 family envelope stress response protein n=1 Tax=Streptomyces cellostaticus TaxID=67285 RepID=A0A101NDH5_9ACTN|nr:hypothetical protein [Streptomyces cellostaticus]KUM91165.1 hypothetical protein AQI88_38220 [Streptomyces cellostaticus]GHI02785.1 hypothetical protein Scel_11060 [Streptomyces cellostaticus]